MVTIRLARKSLTDRYGADSVDMIKKYADIIGYSVEDGEDFSVELNPDRLDLASFPTLISSIRDFYDRKESKDKITFSNEKIITLENDAVKIRPYLVTFTAKGNKIGNNLEILIQYQEKLHETIGKGRTRSSIGIHDLDNVTPPFSFKCEKTDFVFETYDGFKGTIGEILAEHPKGKEYSSLINAFGTAPLITDSSNRVLSMPPIINGAASKLVESTRNFFIDVEGLDLRVVSGTAYLMANVFSAMGYEIVFYDEATDWFPEFTKYNDRVVSLNQESVKTYTDIEPKNVPAYLLKMGYKIRSLGGKQFDVLVPGFRVDVMGEADLIEDIAKAAGYDSVKEKPLQLGTLGRGDPLRELSSDIKSICAYMGFQETMNFFVTSPNLYNKKRNESGLHIINPKSEESSIVRSSLYPSILWTFHLNKRRPTPQKVFEIGSVLVKGKQNLRLCLAEYGSKASFNECRKTLDALCSRTLGELPFIKATGNSDIIHGRGGKIEIGEKEIGIMGEIYPETLIEFDLNLPVTIIEIDLEKFIKTVTQGN